ncbi:MAG: hypothetical protein OHK0017_09560 [Patescibacteria group bacterium]
MNVSNLEKTVKKEMYLLITLLVGLLLACGFFFYFFNQMNEPQNNSKLPDRTLVTEKGRDLSFLTLEYAKTEAELEKGLMYRLSLCDDCGMFFIFPSERPLSFWMKNTYMDLDIIFMDSNGIVTNIADAKAERDAKADSDYPSYTSVKPSQYVLEVNNGWSIKNNLKSGDKIDLTSILK